MRTQRASPVPRFLDVGPDAGPLELLGMSPSECTPSRIEAALQRQLDRVGAHLEGDTPEGDEVRLALHTAAAQLLDPRVRRLIIEEHSAARAPGTVEVEAAPAGDAVERVEPVEPAAMEASASPPALPDAAMIRRQVLPEADANAPVRKLLVIGGVAGALLVVLVIGLIVMTPGKTPTAPTPATSGAPASAAPAAGAGGRSSATASWEGAGAAPKTVPAAEPARAASARSEFSEGSLIVKQLRDASARAKADAAGGLADFARAVAVLADWWPKLETGQRRAADDAVVEFLYVVAEKPEAKDAVGELGKRAAVVAGGSESLGGAGRMSADAVWPAAWATGMLTRLSIEQGLPRSVGALVAQALNDALGAGRSAGTLSFEGGAQAALRRMPVRLVAPPSSASDDSQRSSAEGVKRWADAVGLVAGDVIEVERLLTEGLEQVLLDGPEPDIDQGAYEAVEVLATRIKWRSGGPSRDRLLEWFNDARVSSADLRVLTGVLASKSNAEGVDSTMQLSLAASPDDRAQLRLRYAQAWGMAGTEQRDKAFEAWRTMARVGPPTGGADDDLGKMAALVSAVRVNQAARLLWLGDAPGCSRVLAGLDGVQSTIRGIGSLNAPSPSPMTLPGPSIPALPPGTPTGKLPGGRTATPVAPAFTGEGWAEAYLKAERNIPVRMQRMQEAEALSMPLARVDAQVLVEAACFASPFQVRAAAQRVVERFGDDPSIVQACLDELPLAPKVQNVGDMMSRVSRTGLPKIGDPDWEFAARRALVERVLGLLAGQGPQAGIDSGSALIAESYLAMAGSDSGPPDEGAAERCVRGATQLFKLWRMEAERLPPPEKPPVTLDQMDRRMRSRQQIASGPVQAFSGLEASVAEALAYMVCAERPVQTARVRVVIDDLAKERRESGHVLDQMAATERAISRLWLLRFGEVGQ